MHAYTHMRKLDRVWIIIALVQSVQSVCARGGETHLVFSLYRRCGSGSACAAVLSVYCGSGGPCVCLCRGQLASDGGDEVIRSCIF